MQLAACGRSKLRLSACRALLLTSMKRLALTIQLPLIGHVAKTSIPESHFTSMGSQSAKRQSIWAAATVSLITTIADGAAVQTLQQRLSVLPCLSLLSTP
jgi:hypothetical protein